MSWRVLSWIYSVYPRDCSCTYLSRAGQSSLSDKLEACENVPGERFLVRTTLTTCRNNQIKRENSALTDKRARKELVTHSLFSGTCCSSRRERTGVRMIVVDVLKERAMLTINRLTCLPYINEPVLSKSPFSPYALGPRTFPFVFRHKKEPCYILWSRFHLLTPRIDHDLQIEHLKII